MSVGYCYYWIIGLILWVVGSWGYVRGGWFVLIGLNFLVWFGVFLWSGSSFAGGGEWGWGWLFFLLWGGGLCILGVRLLGCLSWLCY